MKEGEQDYKILEPSEHSVLTPAKQWFTWERTSLLYTWEAYRLPDGTRQQQFWTANLKAGTRIWTTRFDIENSTSRTLVRYPFYPRLLIGVSISPKTTKEAQRAILYIAPQV